MILTMKNIILCGFMGSGKSTIGKRLSQKLKLKFIDTDVLIEHRAKSTINKIITDNGENYFRQMEKEVIANIDNDSDTVIALGGGSVLDTESVEKLQNIGEIYFLNASESTIRERLNSDNTRPLLSKVSFNDRKAIYIKVSDHTIDADQDIENVCKQIIDHLTFEITVKTAKSYKIIIGNGLLNKTTSHIKNICISKRIAIIGDEKVFKKYAKIIIDDLKTDAYEVYSFAFQASEQNKNLHTAEMIYNFLAKNHFSKDDTIISLGGGIISDMVGFVASTYMRGIRKIYIATTLLSGVDASIGGKTGLNTKYGKNLIGTFSQPNLVIIDTDTFNTLKLKELQSGFAEIIKCACISDKEFFELLQDAGKYSIKEILMKTIEIKKNLVELDECENGNIRIMLNFGHTIGHALERLTNFSLSHAEAVSIGICLITKFAEAQEICKKGTWKDIVSLCQKFSLPVDFTYVDEQLIDVMFHDKKANGNFIKCILLKDIGNPVIKKFSKKEMIDVVSRRYEKTDR